MEHIPPGNDYHLLFRLAWVLGLRVSEICGLTWDRVDLDNCTIKIDRQLIRIKTKLYFESPKTDSSIRTVRFGSNMKALLEAEKKRQEENRAYYAEYWTSCYQDGEEIIQSTEEKALPEIFPVCTRENGTMLIRESVDNFCRKICKKVGFDFTFHWLRHSNATNLLDSGLDIKAVQQRMGHSSTRITYDMYIHNTKKMEDKGAVISDSLV